MNKTAWMLFLPFLALTAACTSNIGANNYAVQNVNKVQTAQIGTIISVRKVIVQNENGGGALLGTVAGGVAGSQIGRGSTAGILGALGGAIVGGVAGDIAQSELSKQAGYEYVIQLQNGGIVTVTQGNDVLMTVGEKCMVIYGPQARVIPYGG